MKICYATDYLPNYHRIWGGAEQVCYRLCKVLVKHGHELSILATKPLTTPAENFAFYSIPVLESYFPPRLQYPIRQLKLVLSPYDPLSHLPAQRVLKQLQPDVLHLHNVSSLSFAMLLSARKMGIPTVYSLYDYAAFCPMGHLWKIRNYASYDGIPCTRFHGAYCVECISAYRKLGYVSKHALATLLRFRRRVFDFFLKKVDGFVVLSPANAGVLTEYGISPEKVFSIPIPLSEEFSPRPVEEHSILFSGVIQPRKGLHVLLAAMPEILRRVPDARLYVLGELRANHEYREMIDSLVNRPEVKDHVFLLGRRPYTEVHDFIQKASVFVIPEQWETIAPNTLTEGLVFGKAIVASRIGGLPDFITHGVNGLLAETKDPQDFAAKIVSVMEDKDLRQRLGQEARKTGLEAFSEDNVYIKLLHLYRHLTEKATAN